MDKDFLVGVFAVQLGFATPAQVMAAASAWLADRSVNIPQRLLASGAIDAAKLQMLQSFVAEALKLNEGDVKKTLHSLGGEQVLLRSFGGSVVLDPQGEMRAESPSSAVAGDDRAAESTLVSQEQSGRYVLRTGPNGDAEIGRGGLGRVLLAFDEHLGREVALKELLVKPGGSVDTPRSASGTKTTTLVARFLREARVTGQLEHPNIVPVYEVGQRQDGSYFYSMRVVRGRTLGEKLKACGTLAERLALLPHYIDLCNAIAYAHSRGVVHRDVKPDNVMIGEFGETVVLDWGLAKVRGKKDIRSREIKRELEVLHEAEAGHTVDGSAIGTPAYMSPEQADGRIEEIDEKSDVWGLGAVLYQVLTGRPPFEGVTPFEILGKVIKERVAPVRSQCAEAPPELAAVAEKALQQDRERRYPSAKQLAEEVEGFLHGRRVTAYSYSSWELVRRFVEKNKALSAGAAIVLATLLVSSVVIWFAYGREQVARAAAENQKQEAIEGKQEATLNLAQAHVSAAEQLLRKRQYSGAFVYASAALREVQRSGRELTPEQRVALESVLYESKVRRSLELVSSHPGPGGTVHDIQFSPDGGSVALIDERGQIWVHYVDGSTPSAKVVASVVGTAVHFAADGKSLIAGFIDGKLRTYSLPDLRETKVEAIRTTLTSWWWFSADAGRLVMTSTKGEAWLVRRQEPDKAVSLGLSNWVAFSPDQAQFARTGESGSLTLHDATTGAVSATVDIGKDPGGWIGYSPDGRRLLVSTSAGAIVVDVELKTVVSRLRFDNATSVTGAGTAEGGQWILAPRTGATLWNGTSAKPTEVLWEGGQSIRAAVSPDGRFAALAEAGAVRIFRFRRGGHALLAPTEGPAFGGAFSPDGRRFVYSDLSGRVRLAKLGDDVKSEVLTQHPPRALVFVAYSPSGKHVASIGSDQVVKVHDPETRALVQSRRLTNLSWPLNRISNVAFTADGSRLLVTAPDGRIHVLHPDSLVLERVLTGNLGWPFNLHATPDGRFVYSGDSAGKIVVWDAKSWRLVRFLRTRAGFVSDLTITRDGKTIITAGMDARVRWFALDTGRQVRAIRAHEAWVNRLAISPDGTRLLTGSDDNTAKLWDVSTGELQRVLRMSDQVSALTYSPDGKRMALGGDGGVFFFPDETDLLRADGEALLADAMRSTGLRLDGVALVPQGEATRVEKDEDAPSEDAAQPGEVRGRVADFFFPDKSLPDGTKVELLRENDEEPFSPPVVAPMSKDRRFTALLPDGVDRYAMRITAGNDTTYRHSLMFRRGAPDPHVTIIPLEEIDSLARGVDVKISPTKGQVLGMVLWGPAGDVENVTPVGCATVSLSGGSDVYYAAPRPDSGLHASKNLKLLHPGAPIFYAFNVEPGPHVIDTRVGTNSVKTNVRARAGVVTYVTVYFDGERFKENPTPPLCLTDWPLAPDEGKK